MKLVCILFTGLVGLAGCGGSAPEPARHETVVDPMLETLDRAKAVEDLEQERKRRLDEQLDQN